MFSKYDVDNGGTIDATEFQGLLGDMGVTLNAEQARSFMKRLTGGSTQITFQEAFGNLLGLPKAFFESTIAMPKKATGKQESTQEEVPNRHKKAVKKLDHDVEFEKARRLFVTRLKHKWLNIHNSLNSVFKKQRGQVPPLPALCDLF